MTVKETIHYLKRNIPYCSKNEREASENAIRLIKTIDRVRGVAETIKAQGGKSIDINTLLMMLEEVK